MSDLWTQYRFINTHYLYRLYKGRNVRLITTNKGVVIDINDKVYPTYYLDYKAAIDTAVAIVDIQDAEVEDKIMKRTIYEIKAESDYRKKSNPTNHMPVAFEVYEQDIDILLAECAQLEPLRHSVELLRDTCKAYNKIYSDVCRELTELKEEMKHMEPIVFHG